MANRTELVARNLGLLVLVACGSDGEPKLGDDLASEIIEAAFQPKGNTCFPLGELEVVRSGADLSKGQLDKAAWKLAEELDAAGILETRVVSDPTKGSSSDFFLQLAPRSVLMIVFVRPGPRAGEVGEVKEQDGVRCLSAVDEHYRVKEVIDVFGYRTGKGGSSVIIALAQRLGVMMNNYYLAIGIAMAFVWLVLVFPLTRARTDEVKSEG